MVRFCMMAESWLGARDTDKSLSMAHFSLGSVIGWFFEYLGGIRVNESEPGMKHIVLRPIMPKELGSFAVQYRLKYGMIKTEWHYEGDTPVFSYEVPECISVTLEE